MKKIILVFTAAFVCFSFTLLSAQKTDGSIKIRVNSFDYQLLRGGDKIDLLYYQDGLVSLEGPLTVESLSEENGFFYVSVKDPGSITFNSSVSENYKVMRRDPADSRPVPKQTASWKTLFGE